MGSTIEGVRSSGSGCDWVFVCVSFVLLASCLVV